jgi:NADPH:quinone reductase-like Zn-dependent oxidoreductase
MPTTRAVLIDRLGGPDALVEREVPLRPVGPDDVQIRVLATGVNFADLLMRAGLYGTVPPRPFSPGFEVVGQVTAAGSEVESCAVGDRVVGLIRYGGYAQDIVVPARNVFRAPPSLSPAEAAAVPVVFLTAWVCLFETGHARSGDTALVLGAGGGVGTAAVQLAVQRELRVIGTAGTDHKRAFVTDELGAAACFDSRGDWWHEVEAFAGRRAIDIALDPVGGRGTRACHDRLAPLERIVFYGMSEAMPGRRRNWLRAGLTWLRTRRFHPLSLIVPNAGVFGVHLLHLKNRETIIRPALEAIYRDVVAGALRPIVDRTFPLTRNGAVDAHRYLHERRNLGKVVLVSEAAP